MLFGLGMELSSASGFYLPWGVNTCYAGCVNWFSGAKLFGCGASNSNPLPVVSPLRCHRLVPNGVHLASQSVGR
jgi:hypothetical protein